MNRTRTDRCSICGEPDEAASDYPGLVCKGCDKRAVDTAGKPCHPATLRLVATHPIRTYESSEGDSSAPNNPVFIDGIKCWRRYRLGGWVTMRDLVDANSLSEFYAKQFSARRRE